MSRNLRNMFIVAFLSLAVASPILAAALATGPTVEGPTSVHVAAIDLSIVRGTVRAAVLLQDDLGQSVSNAYIKVSWTLPRNRHFRDIGFPDDSGVAHFEVKKRGRGTYTLTIDEVVAAGLTFDQENSVLSASIETP